MFNRTFCIQNMMFYMSDKTLKFCFIVTDSFYQLEYRITESQIFRERVEA